MCPLNAATSAADVCTLSRRLGLVNYILGYLLTSAAGFGAAGWGAGAEVCWRGAAADAAAAGSSRGAEAVCTNKGLLSSEMGVSNN